MLSRHRRALPHAVPMLSALALLLFILPRTAWANGVNMSFVVVGGIVVLVPLLAFEVFTEGLFLARGLRIPYRGALSVLLGANLASVATGIPVKIFNAWMYSRILPTDLASYFRKYAWGTSLGIFIYFIVTVATEYWVIRRWARRTGAPSGRRRVGVTVLIANLATYAVLAPTYYFLTRPVHDIREFTDDSSWAARPSAVVYYVERPSGHLCSIMTDGSDRRELVPDVVKDYQILPEAGVVLYRNGDNHLALYRGSDGGKRVCWKTSRRFTMDEVAASPDGKWVAYVSGEADDVHLFSVEEGRTIETGIVTDGIAWSSDPGILLAKASSGATPFAVSPAGAVTARESGEEAMPFAPAYGRFGPYRWWGGDNWGAYFSLDKADGVEVFSVGGIASEIAVSTPSGRFALADNPGMLHLARRIFKDACILPGTREIVFDDNRALYLLDIEKRRVGKIADGSDFILSSDRYSRRRAWDVK